MPNPEGYVGMVLHESVKPATENEDRKFYVVHNFDSIVYWNYDKTPSKNDALDQALAWIDIAEAVSVFYNQSQSSLVLVFYWLFNQPHFLLAI